MAGNLEQNGFTQEQLVIYKLGQIESQLASILVKYAENHADNQRQFFEARANHNELRVDHEALKEEVQKHVSRIDGRLNNYRSWIMGAAAVIAILASTLKSLIFNWLGLNG